MTTRALFALALVAAPLATQAQVAEGQAPAPTQAPGAVLAQSAGDAATGCALALVLALDVSGSVDPREWGLQTGGLAQAFRDDAVAEAIEALDGDLLVAVTQWTGASRQAVALDWRRLDESARVAAFADALERMPRGWRHFSTAIAPAIDHAVALGRAAPADCARRVIDISGDGVANEGGPPAAARDRARALGWTINALVIEGASPPPVPHYRAEVIAGPGAFLEVARDFDDYPRAILRKLLREIRAEARVSAIR